MDNEAEVIRNQMADTRSSLQDKLEILEYQVKETVQEATDSVQTVKEAVKETVESVKEGVQETVESVKQSLDVGQQVQNHPWLFFAGAMAVGFVGTRLLSASSPAPRSQEPLPTPSPLLPRPVTVGGPRLTPRNGAKSPPPTAKPSIWSKIAEHYGDELNKLQGLAVGTVAAVIREMIEPATPPALAEQVNDILDSVTTKLGGKPVHGPILAPQGESKEKGEPAEYEHEAQVQKQANGRFGSKSQAFDV